jgi:hypothetical protein
MVWVAAFSLVEERLFFLVYPDIPVAMPPLVFISASIQIGLFLRMMPLSRVPPVWRLLLMSVLGLPLPQMTGWPVHWADLPILRPVIIPVIRAVFSSSPISCWHRYSSKRSDKIPSFLSYVVTGSYVRGVAL